MARKKKSVRINNKYLRSIFKSNSAAVIVMAAVLIMVVFAIVPKLQNYFSSTGQAADFGNTILNEPHSDILRDICDSQPPVPISLYKPVWATVGGSAQRQFKQTRGSGYADYSKYDILATGASRYPVITAFDSLVISAGNSTPVKFINRKTLAVKYSVPIGDKYDNNNYWQQGGVVHEGTYYGIVRAAGPGATSGGAVYAVNETMSNTAWLANLYDISKPDYPSSIMDTGKGILVLMSPEQFDYYSVKNLKFFDYDLKLQWTSDSSFSSGKVFYNSAVATDCAGRIWIATQITTGGLKTSLAVISPEGKTILNKWIEGAQMISKIFITNRYAYVLPADTPSVVNSVSMQIYDLTTLALSYEQVHSVDLDLSGGYAYNDKTKKLFSIEKKKSTGEPYLRAYDVSGLTPVLKWEKQLASGAWPIIANPLVDVNGKVYSFYIYQAGDTYTAKLVIYTDAGNLVLDKVIVSNQQPYDYSISPQDASMMDQSGYLYWPLNIHVSMTASIVRLKP